MSVVVELRGGPFSGQMVGLNVPPWCPPLTLWFPETLPMPVHEDRRSLVAADTVAVHAYDRHPSPVEYGPVWRYMYRQPE